MALVIVILIVICFLYLFLKRKKEAKCTNENKIGSSKINAKTSKGDMLPTVSISTDYSSVYIRNPEIDCLKSRHDDGYLTPISKVQTAIHEIQPKSKLLLKQSW